jgi:hypothetical protein
MPRRAPFRTRPSPGALTTLCAGPCGGKSVSPGSVCGEPATVLVEHGCVHEHIGTETVCAGHAGKIGDREMACTECWRAGHYCPVVIRAAESPP